VLGRADIDDFTGDQVFELVRRSITSAAGLG
jgi:hypothetical protein